MQDAERLAKESSNIVEQLEQREAGLLQEPVNKFRFFLHLVQALDGLQYSAKPVPR